MSEGEEGYINAATHPSTKASAQCGTSFFESFLSVRADQGELGSDSRTEGASEDAGNPRNRANRQVARKFVLDAPGPTQVAGSALGCARGKQ